MNSEVKDLWERAIRNFRTAALLSDTDPDSAASRAYYAAFHAVSALFALEQKAFTSHKAVQVAVHRDLVKTGRWPPELGQAFATLVAMRDTGDYGVGLHITPQQARDAVAKAKAIIEAVRTIAPEPLPELLP